MIIIKAMTEDTLVSNVGNIKSNVIMSLVDIINLFTIKFLIKKESSILFQAFVCHNFDIIN